MKRLGFIVLLSACGSDVQAVHDASVEPSPDVRSDVALPEPEPTTPRYVEPRRSILTNDQVGRLAIPFQENDGQWPDDVAFKVDHFAGSLWVTNDGSIVYSLLGPQVDEAEPEPLGLGSSLTAPNAVTDPFGLHRAPSSLVEVIDPSSTPINIALERDLHDPFERHHELPNRGPGWTLVEHFVHGHPHHPRGLNPAVTNVSYFIGNDESKWAPHVSTFGALTLGEVWPGIEVRLVARGNNVEKFFHVRPHRDPSLIEMSIEGSEPLRLSDDGALIVATGNGEVELSPPVAFQVIDGERREVEVRYEPVTSDSYRFILGDYDRSYEVVVDPILQSTYLGGSGYDATSRRVTLDSSGNVLVVGGSVSADFPGTSGGAQPSSGGVDYDIVISRLNGSLTTLLQSTYLGGSNSDINASVTVDNGGNVLVAGLSVSTDFPGTLGGVQGSLAGGEDIVISRLNASLTALLQSTYLGGSDNDGMQGLTLDSAGNVLVAGFSGSTDYPGTAGGAQPSPGGFGDCVISRLNGSLTALLQSTYLGGSAYEWSHGLTLDTAGNVLVVGRSQSTDYPGTAGGAQPSFAGGDVDIVIARLNGSLTVLLQSTYLGGSGTDQTNGGVTLDSSGNVLVVGFSNSTDYPGTAGGAQVSLGGDYDMVVSRLNNSLTTLLQSTYLGGPTGYALTYGGVTLDSSGSVLVAGYSGSPNYPGTTGGAHSSYSGGGSDIVISRLNGSLTTLLQSTYLGGSGNEQAQYVALDSAGNILVAGWTDSTDCAGTLGGAQETSAGGGEIIVTRLTADLLGCSNNDQCLTATAPNVPNPAGGPIFSGRRFCNTTTAQCEACGSATYYLDADDDGFGDGQVSNPVTQVQDACLPVPTGFSLNRTDCDDSNQLVYPGASEICGNGVDDDCDTVSDEGCPACINNTDCSGNSPLCDGTIGLCVPCTDPDVTCPSGVCITSGSNQGRCGACNTSGDCAGTTPLCLPSTNTCVSCADPNATSMNVMCPANTMCDSATGACVPTAGCEDDTDCSSPTPTCDPNTRLCIGCGDGSVTCQNGDLCDPDTGRCGLDPTQDADNDGILNGVECSALRNCPDTDDDTIPDYLDPDDDGDSIPTSSECPNPSMCLDTDGDGTSNYLDTDDDGDGITTLDEVADGLIHGGDVDLDGIPNYLSTDSDRDGSSDRIEGRNNSPNSIPAYLDVNFLGGGGIAGGALRCSVRTRTHDAPIALFAFCTMALGFVRRRWLM